MAPRRSTGELIELDPRELAARIASGLPRSPGECVREIREAASRYYHTDAASARKIAERAVVVAELTGDATALAWGRRAMAEALLFSGRIADSNGWYEKAAAAARAAGECGLLGQLLAGHVHVLALLGRLDAAERAAAEAKRQLTRARDIPHLARLSMSLAAMYFQRDRYEKSLAECERGSELFRSLHVRDRAVVGLEVNHAVALTQLDRHEEALELFSRLDRECGSRGYDLLRAQIWMNAAFVYSLRAEFDLALGKLSMATTYFRQTNHPTFLAACLLNRAEVYHQLNLHADALELTEEASALFASEGLRYDEALASYQGALSCLAMGEIAAALRSLRRALRLFEREKNAPRAALMRMLWGEALLGGRRYREAREQATLAVREFHKLGLARWEAMAAVLLSRLEARDGSAGRAAPRLARLSRRLSPEIHPLPSYRLLEALGEAQERRGRTRPAETSYRHALRTLEGMRVRVPTEDSKIAFLRDKTHLYDRLLAIEIAKPKPSTETLFDLLERSRSQQIWDRFRVPSASLELRGARGGRATAGRRTGRSEMRARIENQRRQIAWLHARLSALEMGSATERLRARTLEEKLGRAESAWRRILREAGEELAGGLDHGDLPPPRRGRKDGAGAPGIAEIARSLPDGWGFLSYHVGPDFSLVVAVTKDGTAWRRLTPDLGIRLARLNGRLEFQWGAASLASASHTLDASAPLYATTDAILGELHGLLWKPLEELGAGRSLRWIISPHGPIHRIPMHALRDRDGYLIERTDLSVTPGARIRLALPGAGKRGARSAWLAGVPSPQLPAVGIEVEHVRRRLKGWRVHTDLQPTREAFRRFGPRSALLHLAAHGSLRPDNPAYSFVELADGPLFVHDLGGVRLPGSVVVLSSCSSGRGERLAGDEWIGLARGFLQAGASAVVTSLWPIEDQTTSELMDAFYAAFATGEGAPRALGDAMRATMARRRHPWQWAAFAPLGGV